MRVCQFRHFGTVGKRCSLAYLPAGGTGCVGAGAAGAAGAGAGAAGAVGAGA